MEMKRLRKEEGLREEVRGAGYPSPSQPQSPGPSHAPHCDSPAAAGTKMSQCRTGKEKESVLQEEVTTLGFLSNPP